MLSRVVASRAARGLVARAVIAANPERAFGRADLALRRAGLAFRRADLAFRRAGLALGRAGLALPAAADRLRSR